LVLEDLQRAIDMDFPRSEDPDAAKLEEAAHLSLEERMSRVYVGELAEMEALDKYVEGADTRPVLITGDSGSGTSYYGIYLFLIVTDPCFFSSFASYSPYSFFFIASLWLS
jgi:hypothetical protein